MIIVEYEYSVNDCVESSVLFYDTLEEAINDIYSIRSSSDYCKTKIYKGILL